MTPGYSGTPLAKKLGWKPGGIVYAIGAPNEYKDWLEIPVAVEAVKYQAVPRQAEFVHLFTASRDELKAAVEHLRKAVNDEAILWISWPKKASKVPTDITEQDIRDVSLPIGWVDVKVCAVSEVWSGLKLVVRKELRR